MTVRIAVDRLQQEVSRDPAILRGSIRPRDLTRASITLEATYHIRLFVEFETGLRLYWATLRDTNPRSVHLLNTIAAQRVLPTEQVLAYSHYRIG